ncbi:hypothetical protein J7I91_21115 [Pseudomonas sp. ISL-84]|nr:hypothetical protein [Pseudomonas sp. ISL-84]
MSVHIIKKQILFKGLILMKKLTKKVKNIDFPTFSISPYTKNLSKKTEAAIQDLNKGKKLPKNNA